MQFSQNWAYLITSKLKLYPLGMLNQRNGSILDQLDKYLTRTRSNTGNAAIKTIFDIPEPELPDVPSQFSIKSFADCQNSAFGSSYDAEEFLVLLYDGLNTRKLLAT